nr:hypothetical protein [Tanacetum cinerariifolium]
MTTDTRLIPSVSLIPEDLHMDDDTAPDEQVHSYDDEDIRNAHILKASALASTYTPPPKNSLLAQTGDMAIFMDLFCKRQGITELKPQDLEGPAFELVKNKNLMENNIDALYNTLKQNQGDVNDAMGSKKKIVVVTSDPLALIVEKTNVTRSKDDFSELKK